MQCALEDEPPPHEYVVCKELILTQVKLSEASHCTYKTVIVRPWNLLLLSRERRPQGSSEANGAEEYIETGNYLSRTHVLSPIPSSLAATRLLCRRAVDARAILKIKLQS